MTRQRGLSSEDAALWRRVARGVTPLAPSRDEGEDVPADGSASTTAPERASPALARLRPGDDAPARKADVGAARTTADRHGLDAGWERRIARGLVDPDVTLDLHGATLDIAYARLDHGLRQARTMGARVVLLITGRPRPVEAADRGHVRGAIRAKIGDWIAAGEHGAAIAAIRVAHRRHGGPGALYLVMRRRR